jgi:arginase
MARIALIGVPSQSGGRPVGVARGAGALRAAGLVTALRGAGHEVVDRGDVALPHPDPARDPVSKVVNPQGLSAVIRAVASEVGAARWEGGFPMVIGGDCPMLLGGLWALPRVGLLHVDGHEDAYPPERSPTGDAADSEIAFAVGTAPMSWDEELAAAQPFVRVDHVAMLGPRDRPDLEHHGVESLAGRCSIAADDEVRSDPLAITSKALGLLANAPGGFWFHLDWDVLSNEEIASVIFPRPGGLTWPDLSIVAGKALADPVCRGWSAGTYNPDLDPDGTDALRIVRFLTEGSSALDDREEPTS